MKALWLTLVVVGLVPLLAAPPFSWGDDDGNTCPRDSKRVGTTCVDIFEASVWSIPATNTSLIKKVKQGRATEANLLAGGATQVAPAGTCDSSPPNEYNALNFPETGNWTAPLYAVSIPGVLPSACLTWFQAEQACALSDKRLLTNQEWQRAAAGTVDPGANDGLINTMCNTNAAGPRNTGLAGATPGGADSCISNWRVQDMIGNVWEWVGDWGDRANMGCTDWTTSAGIAGGDLSCVGGDGSSAPARLPGALIRGGGWSDGVGAGVFAVNGIGPSSAIILIGDGGSGGSGGSVGSVGFRCAR
jgi:formylglycine-generating enzyme required for sulfatase activity